MTSPGNCTKAPTVSSMAKFSHWNMTLAKSHRTLAKSHRQRPDVTTERQIAANRRNARNSAGPRSRAGRKRASHNSQRHGLTATMAASAEWAKRVEMLARKIAGNTTDPVVLECAHSIAHAELDLARIRRVKVALIERMLAFGEFDEPLVKISAHQTKKGLNKFVLTGMISEPVEGALLMPTTEPERSAEAVRRALPELLKLDRYERRATARRRRSLSATVDRIIII